jgi:RNA polymerase sigma-70 factor (ECF subfamily)
MPSGEIAAAFDSLQHSLRGFLRRRVKDPTVAEDLLQDIFVKALAANSADRAPKNLPGWLYAAARTTVIDYYRASRPATEEIDQLASDTETVDDEHLHRELATCLRPLVRQLPAIYRDTLLATDFDGATMQAVAKEQGLSVSAIKSRASRGRVMLKEKLLDCCHVEMSSGVVADYHHRSSSTCEGDCA